MIVVTPSREDVLDFCAADPVERVFLEEVARRGNGRFRAVVEARRIVGLCHAGANLVPSGRRCGAFARLVDGNARMIIGEERAVAELWHAARAAGPTPRDDRPGQPVYELRSPPPSGGSGLRPARRDDLPALLPACAAAHREELGVDPMLVDPTGFRWRTETQIDEGRSWVWIEGGTIRFKAEVSAWTAQAVQLQQVWVDPAARGRGDGTRGLSDLCRLLLARTPVVCLFVRRENEAAIRLYEAIGMRRVLTYRSLLF